MKVAILIATRQRPDMLRKACYELQEDTEYKDFFVELIFDGDQAGYNAFDKSVFSYQINKHYTRKQGEYIKAINKAYSFALAKADLFVPWSDDQSPSKGWLTKAVDRYQACFPDGGGLLSFNDGYWDDRLATQCIFDKKFVELCGYSGGQMRFPGYIHYGSDNEITEIAKAAGVFAYAEDIRIYHPTPLEKEGYDSIIHKAHDRELWLKRREEIS